VHRGRAALAAALALLAVVRCDGSGPPRLAQVVPQSGPWDHAVPIVISGRSLLPEAHADVGCDGHATVDARFDAQLGAIALREVTWQADDQLSAVVPLGITPGTYDLTVRTPQGLVLVLPEAYTALSLGDQDGGVGDAAGCELLDAVAQDVQGSAAETNGTASLGPPDGNAATLMGQLGQSQPPVLWSFTFGASTRTGPIVAQASITLWQIGWVDDRMLLEASTDAGATWATLKSYGAGAASLPATRSEEGPVPLVLSAPPASGQLRVRLRGNGLVGAADDFTLLVDAVVVQICQ